MVFQRPKRASVISTNLQKKEKIWVFVFQRPKRASVISTRDSGSIKIVQSKDAMQT